jgi:hypothetical protein
MADHIEAALPEGTQVELVGLEDLFQRAVDAFIQR